MKITRDTAVTLNFRITDLKGKPLESGTTSYLHGGYENLFPKAEELLEGKDVGESINCELQPADAFGDRDESLTRTLAKADFPPGVKVGGQLQGPGPDGQPRLFHVVKIKGPEVLLDGNHPLAGQAIRFAATVKEVRAATAEEITHRHVHGDHGHHH